MKEKKKLKRSSLYMIVATFGFILTLLLMRKISPEFMRYTQGDSLLDMYPGYDTTYVYQILNRLGTAGRNLYIKQLAIDFIFILSFLVLQNELLKWVMGERLRNTPWRFSLSLAYFRAFFDMAENIFILILLLSFPVKFRGLVYISSLATSIKFLFLILWLIALSVIFIIRIVCIKEMKKD